MGFFDDIPDGAGTSNVALASTFADAEDIRRYQSARAAGASEGQALAVGDNGVSAFGDDTTNPNDPIIALPPDTPGFAHNRFVELTGPDGRSGIARVSEKMPPTSKLKGDASIDLNPAAARLVGHPGGVYPLSWRFIDQPNEDNSRGAAPDDLFADIPTRPAAAPSGSPNAAGAKEQTDYFGDIPVSPSATPSPTPQSSHDGAKVPPTAPGFMDKLKGVLKDDALYIADGIGDLQDRLKSVSDYVAPGFFDQATTSPLHSEPLRADPKDSRAVAVGKASYNVTTNLLEGVTSPAMLATGLAGSIPQLTRVVSGAFAADMTANLPQQYAQVRRAEATTPEGSQERIEAGLQLAASLAMIHAAADHAGGRRAAPGEAGKTGEAVVTEATETPEKAATAAAAPPSDLGADAYRNEQPTAEAQRVTSPPPVDSPGAALEEGTIPIEDLAPQAQTAEAEPAFLEDPVIPFMTKVRLQDQFRSQGMNEEQIGALKTSDVQDRLRAGASDAPSVSPSPTQTSETFPNLRDDELQGRPLQEQPSREELAAEAQSQQEALEAANEHQAASGPELLDAIKDAGGLPAKASPYRRFYVGEIDRLSDAARDPHASARNSANEIFRATAPDVDELVTRLRDRGFNLETPADLFDAVESRLRTGKANYGNPFAPAEPQLFASGSAAPRQRARSAQERAAAGPDALPGISRVNPDLSETPSRLLDVPRDTSPNGGENQPNDPSSGVQGRTFASGIVAPRRAPGPPPPSLPGARGGTPPTVAAVPAVRSWWIQRTIGLRKLVAPQTIDLQARRVGNIVRDYSGRLANKIVQADHALAAARRDFDRTPVPSNWKYDPAKPLPRNYAFMAESERGGASLHPSDRALKTQLDSMFAEAVDEVHRVKPAALKTLIQDYFPHIWRDPEAARAAFAGLVGSRPLEGGKSFLKKRALAYIEDGLKLGLRPVSDNPIDIALTKLHEVHKFVAAQDILNEANAIGARKFVYVFEKPPEGWLKVDDPSSRVNAPPYVTVPEAFDAQMKAKTIDLLDSLGIKHERLSSLGGKRWGTFENAGGGIKTKFAGPISVYWHELGHGLQERYQWIDTILRGERPGGNSPVALELRKLADLRAEGTPPNKSFRKYIRTTDEKAAVILEAYLHAPRRMQDVAPITYGRVQKFIEAHPELKPINEIRPSLVLGTAKAEVPVGGLVTLGHYYMPEGAASVLNNYLSPGLQRFQIIRSIRNSTNILSSLQLGLSAFHLGFTSIDAAVSQFALGLRYASEGKLGKAAARISTFPLAPITNYYLGKAVQAAMIDPHFSGEIKLLGRSRQLSSHGTDVANEIAQLAIKAGLRATVDPFWKTQVTRNMVRAWHEGGVKGYAGTILRLPFAASEQMMRPILEYLVPRQKLGVFAGMAQQHMEALGPNADIHAVRDAMAKAADATEDRMGQMTYDNLFYNRVVRDAALIGFRAYGWTFGKYRALFGGLGDAVGSVGRIREGGPILTDRMAYLLALPMVAGVMGSVMNYTMTGELPKDWRDALMPRTGKFDLNGNPQRLSLPTYVKDLLSDWIDFPNPKKMVGSLANKLNPWFAIGVELLNNADFYNTTIAEPDDPFYKRQADRVAFVAKSAVPFSVTSGLKLSESKPGIAEYALPFFGFVPAKASLTMTPAQLRAAELMRDQMPAGARTREQAEHSALLKNLLQDLRNGGQLPNLAELRPGDAKRLQQRASVTPFEYQATRLGLDSAMKVWDLANPQERELLRPLILKKLHTSKTVPEDRKSAYRDVLLRPEGK